jgi:hypothetical protein
MRKQLILVHGRAQQNKDSHELKAEWIGAWERGLRKSGLSVPIDEHDIRFPYYGQALFDLVHGAPETELAEVIVRGAQGDREELEFMRSVVDEARKKAGVTDAQVEAHTTAEVSERGVLNWTWVQAALSAIDRHVPGASGASIAIATRDVYRYLRNPGIKNTIDTGVRAALQGGVPAVVVAHSLGTVVAFDLLRRDGVQLGWNVPLFVTLGSPLAVSAIRKSLRPLRFPGCVSAWYNAMDEQDVVALYPLVKPNFDVTPPIVNKTDVDNHTENRHGITGYLDDQEVARKIYDVLV